MQGARIYGGVLPLTWAGGEGKKAHLEHTSCMVEGNTVRELRPASRLTMLNISPEALEGIGVVDTDGLAGPDMDVGQTISFVKTGNNE